MSFWHINQYAQSGVWHTRIGKFNLSAVAQAPPHPQHLLAVGRQGRICQAWAFALSAFISRPTASFMEWADGARILPAAISLIRLNIDPSSNSWAPRPLLTRTTR